MSVNFADMPWLVTVTGDDLVSETYGPQSMADAVALRDRLRVGAPDRTVEAWASQLPNLAAVKSPDAAPVAA